MKKLFVFLAAACLGCLSCSPPPFDLAISLSTLTVKGMILEGTVGPVDKMNGDQAPQDAAFIPEYTAQGGLDLQNGFLRYTQPDGRWLSFVTWDASQGLFHKLPADFPLGPLPGGSYPDIITHVPQDAALRRIGGFTFDPANPAAMTYNELRADSANQQLTFAFSTQPGFNLPPLFGVIGKVIGVSLPPSTSATDTAYLLAEQDVTGSFLEFSMSMVPGGLSFAAAPRGFAVYNLALPGLPQNVDRVQYFFDPAAIRSFLSWYDASPGQNRWRCWSWSDTTAGHGVELAGVDHRIDALLSTGELFSTESDTGRVYGSDGTLLAVFPLAGVTFVDERSIGGTARLIFSQSLFYARQPRFNIYSIPTVDVKTLVSK